MCVWYRAFSAAAVAVSSASTDGYPPHAIHSEYVTSDLGPGKPLSSPWHWRTRWGDGHTIPCGASAAHQNLDQPNPGQACHGASLSFRRKGGERRVWRQSDNHEGGQDAREGAKVVVPIAVARDTSKYIQVSTSRDAKVVPFTDQPR